MLLSGSRTGRFPWNFSGTFWTSTFPRKMLSKMIAHPVVHRSRFSLDLPGKSWMWIAGAVLVVVLATFAGRTLLRLAGTPAGETAQGIPSLQQGKYVAI